MIGCLSTVPTWESAVTEDAYRARHSAADIPQYLDIHQRHNAAAIGTFDLDTFIPEASTGRKGDGHGTFRGRDMRAAQV
ncbi:hypothetical protein XH94_01025 [Bradyrhizobium zhanjiangense]|uniref:Uncharacterized protein n=1 Tax=Bradyrhizobium zhanjiangense TaxID=1325107 RepID=A0A4Q0SVU2_9BRAD|nr:hypothetical protein XH94_01025 [Bradyrhizobium zhanjiangense]